MDTGPRPGRLSARASRFFRVEHRIVSAPRTLERALKRAETAPDHVMEDPAYLPDIRGPEVS